VVVDDRDFFRAELRHRVLAEHLALLHVVRHYAKRALVALVRVLGIGRRGGDLRDARVMVDPGGGDRRAGVEVADDAGDPGVHQLLRDDGSGLGIGLIVLAHQLEFHFGAADRHALRVELLDRQPRAVVVVLAEMRLRAGQRRHLADPDDDGRSRLRGAFAAAREHECGRECAAGEDEGLADHTGSHLVNRCC